MLILEKIDKLFEEIFFSNDYLKRELDAIGKRTQEVQSVFYLKQNKVIQNKRFDIASGDYKSVRFNTKDIVDQALELGADTVIGVHNHPNHTLQPSKADINTFRSLKNELSRHKVGLKAYIASYDGFKVRYNDYDDTTDPNLHTQEYIMKAQDTLSSLGIKFDYKDIENKFSHVENITGYQQTLNKILEPHKLQFIPRGA
jgi:proteasome lid subunit RPN8/RPN11